MNITFRQLRLFLALAETGSVSGAANSGGYDFRQRGGRRWCSLINFRWRRRRWLARRHWLNGYSGLLTGGIRFDLRNIFSRKGTKVALDVGDGDIITVRLNDCAVDLRARAKGYGVGVSRAH